MAKYLTEIIGTFFLVLTICLTIIYGYELAALAIGGVMLAVVYMGGHISGAHYNPAVSLAVAVCGKMHWPEVARYWLCQLAGAILGALMASLIASTVMMAENAAETERYVAPAAGAGLGLVNPAPWLIEVLFTFALCLVVLNVAVSRRTQNNSYYGLAIGITVAAGTLIGAPISGAAYNPAVGLGPNLVKGILGGDSGAWPHLLLYTVGPFFGAALAAAVFRIQEEYEVEPEPPLTDVQSEVVVIAEEPVAVVEEVLE